MRYLLLALFLSSSMSILAQGSDPLPPASGDVPIDGGILGLLTAGAVYGYKKLRKSIQPK